MKRYLVTRTLKLTKVIEANSKAEAMEFFSEDNADFSSKDKAELLHGSEPRNLPGSLHNRR